MKALVTGGGGFLGGAIVRRLLERGDEVRSFARGDYPELRAAGVEIAQGDLVDPRAVRAAVEGTDVVFHVAAKAGVWGPWQDYYNANFVGTTNVVQACLDCGVPKLVYTSTPSVVFDGGDMEGADESAPYAEEFETHYPKTKKMAERLVREVNGDRLATVSLRPHLIWGPGDNHLVPRILARARTLRRIGDGANLVDTIYVDNAADAHLLAADRLEPGSAVAGRVYFISNGEPLPLWDIVDRILAAGGLPPVRGRISPAAAVRIGGAMEFVYRALRIRSEPRLTRFVARELSTSHWFDISAARRDLGYEPAVSFEEGMKRLEAWIHSPEGPPGLRA